MQAHDLSHKATTSTSGDAYSKPMAPVAARDHPPCNKSVRVELFHARALLAAQGATNNPPVSSVLLRCRTGKCAGDRNREWPELWRWRLNPHAAFLAALLSWCHALSAGSVSLSHLRR
jgi:hypothetical protein